VFIGHFGLAMAAKKVAPRPSLGTLVLAALLLVFGPPPPSVQVLAMAGLLGWLFIVWVYWIDRQREPASRQRIKEWPTTS
jgi:hypothetical protein